MKLKIHLDVHRQVRLWVDLFESSTIGLLRPFSWRLNICHLVKSEACESLKEGNQEEGGFMVRELIQKMGY